MLVEKMLNISDRQGNANQRYHLKSVRMAIIKKTTDTECWQGSEAAGIAVQAWWG